MGPRLRSAFELSRLGAEQAWKILIPRDHREPNVVSHEGYEWLYVLTGRVRLILGDRDLELGPSEVAEFDTLAPHWFGSTGNEAAEVLSLFGPQGPACPHAHRASA